MADFVIRDMDEAKFKSMLKKRDEEMIHHLIERMSTNNATLIEQATGSAKKAILGDGIEFNAAVDKAVQEAWSAKKAEWEQELPDNVRKIIDAQSAAASKNIGDASTIITRQSLEDGWLVEKMGQYNEGYMMYDVPIVDFFQDIDEASGVNAARRSNLDAIFAMIATNPFAPYVTMNSSTSVGQIDFGILSGISFTDDQVTTGTGAAKRPDGTARAAGDVITGTVGELAAANITIRRYYCNFLVSNAALEQVQNIRSSAVRAITQAFVRAVGLTIIVGLNGATVGTAAGNLKEVKTGVAAALPTAANFPGFLGKNLAAPFPESMVRGSTAWVVRQEMWEPLAAASIGEGFSPERTIPMVWGYPWHPTSLLAAVAENAKVGYFGNFREAIAVAVGPTMRIEINRTTHPGYTYFHAEGAIGATVHNTSGTVAVMTVKA